MSSISNKFTVSTALADAPNAKEQQGAALRRLHLSGKAAENFQDVLHLDSSDFAAVARTVDAELQTLQKSQIQGRQASGALTQANDLLEQAAKLVDQNTTPGSSRNQRRQVQRQIDELLKQAGEALDARDDDGVKPLGGGVTLHAGDQSLELAELSLKTLGHVVINGQSHSIGDIQSHGSLDTSRRRSSIRIAARRSIEEALKTAASAKAEVDNFLTTQLRTRVSDVATVSEGFFQNTSAGQLGSTAEAVQTAKDVRALLLESGTAAISIGAEGWDRDRLVSLLTPSK